jgi:hypothetical protein
LNYYFRGQSSARPIIPLSTHLSPPVGPALNVANPSDTKSTSASTSPSASALTSAYRQKGGNIHGPEQKSTTSSASSKPPVAIGRFANMVGKNTPQAHHSRPPLSSQQSNSVPSTPHQRARRDFTGSRSPSPHGRLSGSHSPGLIHSEVNGYLSSLPKGRPVCKYEGSARLSSRRRMQYDIGDAPLEDPQVVPKKSLDPDEDKKLTGDMRELYDRLLPSEDSEKRRHAFVKKLERILHKEWPSHKFTVNVFGSSGNMLCTSDSDGIYTILV